MSSATKMDSFYKNNYVKMDPNFKKNDIEFQIIEWFAQDESNDDDDDEESEGGGDNVCKEKYMIRCFGVTNSGVSVTCKIQDFTPFYYIKVPNNFDKVKLQIFLNHIKDSWSMSKKGDDGSYSPYYKSCLLVDKCSIVERKDLYGFNNGKLYKFVRLVFDNYTAMNKSKYIFKKALSIQGINTTAIKYKLYESNFEPFMRFCHIKDILMAGWVKIPKGKYNITSYTANTQIELEINWKHIVSLKEKQDIGNFLQASWDIETYSYDGSFPDPNLKHTDKKTNEIVYPNVIYQIATTFKYYKEQNTLVRHLFTLKNCEDINDPTVVVEECKTEKELILKWVDLISKMDPDVMYTYNGDTFDCMYVFERSKIYNIDDIVKQKLSRLSNVKTTIKKETFSSSAYGDSDFVRFYIPGRLNYDLLIHYKRGMTKYPSYKLDYISNEILKEGKNEVSVKEIFSFYKEGRPDQIKTIGLYCIQDTELLQKLVDKQLILITIIQLANVTFVPIGFLTTRGQTIKVFSQVLRKARQMEFLVPHTNFNEDSYGISIKTKDAHHLDEDNIGQYIEIDCGKMEPDSTSTYSRSFKVTGKLSEVVDDNEFIILSDTEIQKPMFNKKCKLLNGKSGSKEFWAKQMFSCDDAVDSSFTGATVLEPTPGMYTDNIAVLDFASLYPTIMISRNLCYSTFVMDKKYLDIPGVNYETIAWDDKVEYKLKHTCDGVGKTGKSKGQVCGKQAYFEVENKLLEKNEYFCRIHDPLKKSRDASEKFQKRDVSYNYTVVQPTLDENGEIALDNKGLKINQGVLPALLEDLYAERKKVKRQMAKAADEGNTLLEKILDSTQLAIKVSLNSCYGFLGRGQGNLILKELGSIVTSVGRQLIEQSKEYAEGPFTDYIRDNNLLTQQLCTKEYDMSEQEKDIILKQFRI